MRNLKKNQAKYAPSKSAPPKNVAAKPEMKAAPVVNASIVKGAPIKAVYYGLEEQLLLNITAVVVRQCLADAEESVLWSMPADDVVRANMFGDPIPNVAKKVFVCVDRLDDAGVPATVFLYKDNYAFTYFDGVLSLHEAK